MKQTLKRILTFGLAAVALGAAYLQYRTYRMNHLYTAALGELAISQGSAQSEQAVRQLATYRGRRATEMLLAIAIGNGQSVFGGAQTAAVRELAKRSDPAIAVALARLLQPHEGLERRQTVARALQVLPCNEACSSSVLHYLERIWEGELNYEDRTIFPTGTERLAAIQKKDQELLYEDLRRVLRQNENITLSLLVEQYGIGSDSPSPFALDLVADLGLSNACHLLLQSQELMQHLPLHFYNEPRQETEDAIETLSCK